MSEHHRTCAHFPHYAGEQLRHLQHCIDENKWYLSEKAGRDVGPAVAEKDFVERHLDRVAADFRERYCRERCSGRQQCSLSALVGELNRRWEARTWSQPQRAPRSEALSA